MTKMPWHEACQLDSSLLSLQRLFKVSPDYAETLTEGLTNCPWRIMLTNGNSYVWKSNASIVKTFSISRFQEYHILSNIRSSSIASNPILVNDQGLLVDWIEKDPLSSQLNFDSLLKIMVKIHQIDLSCISLPPFNFTKCVDRYWLQIKNEFRTSEYWQLYHSWRDSPNLVNNVKNTLCHFDLTQKNIIKTKFGNKVIDWEYASIADPRLDLTLTINTNKADVLKSVYRYCQLRKIEKIDDWFQSVLVWQPKAMMMTMLWYLLGYQLWKKKNYLREAEGLRSQLRNNSLNNLN
ncbi:thiamine kinase [Candidatus Photodesmus blepharus]|uniref:Thiamine kinase n=1 Tax=Candidatus Photodesmus blepharonis TaxID=1179155 RepID=A0A084CMP3_9GAMM|nr:phosphotransferase [Candidatus Photodesmus blepharus]KEY91072.1 thiamine kinase [Candidatus Photodesmus blepharus]